MVVEAGCRGSVGFHARQKKPGGGVVTRERISRGRFGRGGIQPRELAARYTRDQGFWLASRVARWCHPRRPGKLSVDWNDRGPAIRRLDLVHREIAAFDSGPRCHFPSDGKQTKARRFVDPRLTRKPVGSHANPAIII